jgi:acetylornithine aminotransferase/acetylornithine/N-succinyldiaminopimelate aminotransferase
MSLLPTYGHRLLEIARAHGCFVYDPSNKPYLDFITGIGVNALGYGHPRILAELHHQADLCIHTSNLHRHPWQQPLADTLAQWSGLDQVFLSNSGTEAMEAALKAARARANRLGRRHHRIIALDNGFHGRSAAALSITHKPEYRQPFQPLVPGTLFVPANSISALEEAANEDTIAVVAETIQGEGGIHPLTEEFLAAIRTTATRRNALWIADETQCGHGRTGRRFAYLPNHRPDIVVTAKPLAAGLPLGATIFSNDAAQAIQPGAHGSTFGGGPLTCRLALAFLNEVDRLLPAIQQNGAYLHSQLRTLTSPLIKEVRGQGFMAGIELTVPAAPYVETALALGLVINATHTNVLRLLPPYIAAKPEIDQAITILARIL